MDNHEKLTITLTGARPVRVTKADWPIVARADWHDGQVRSQANLTHLLIVRQHADGRAIVYGIYSSNWANESDARGGYMLDVAHTDGELVAAIRSVAEELDFDVALAQRCVAALPARDAEESTGGAA